MQHLLDGYARFRESAWPERRALFERLAAQGQRPRTMVIACSDSRVDPAMIFSAGPGELFVVRNVANLVPPYQPDGNYHGTSAALEFGVCNLEVQDLIVLGHGLCGGVQALALRRRAAGRFRWPLDLSGRARPKSGACLATRRTSNWPANMRWSLSRLRTLRASRGSPAGSPRAPCASTARTSTCDLACWRCCSRMAILLQPRPRPS